MTDFDRKIIENFPGKIVRKDLTSLMKKGANVPTYVLEYLLGMYCATDDEEAIEMGIQKIKHILSENYVRPDQSEYVKSKIKENGQYTLIDKVTVELDTREDKYVARFVNLNIAPFEVSADLVVHNEKLLVGGVWCIVKIEYVGLDKEDPQEQNRPVKLMDWEQDFQFLVSPVNRVLGREIRAEKYLHWWTFLSAYMEIGECTFAQIVHIRNMKAHGKRLSKQDQEWYAQNRRLVDMKTNYTPTEKELLKKWGGA